MKAIRAEFDASVFNGQELELGVVVQVSNREVRYSKFPEIPLFGRVTHGKNLEELRCQRDEIAEQYAQRAFDVQMSRLHEHCTICGLHLAWHFYLIRKP